MTGNCTFTFTAPSQQRHIQLRMLEGTGGFTRTWLEHMLDIERRRLVFSGKPPAEVNAAMRAFSGFYDETLNQGKTPAQAIAAHPQWKSFWYDEPTRQYGRLMRYYQQLQALDVEGAWAEVSVPTLIIWGQYDWIMGRDEAERAAQIVAARDPGLVTLVVRPGMNHHFMVYPDAKRAFDERGGTFDEGAARTLVEWLRGH